MKALIWIANILIYLLVAFFVMFSFDAFVEGNSFWMNLLGFFIHLIPAILIFLINFLLRKKHLILGIVLIVLSVVAFFFFKFYIDFLEKIITILIVLGPLLFSGVVHIVFYKKNLHKNNSLS